MQVKFENLVPGAGAKQKKKCRLRLRLRSQNKKKSAPVLAPEPKIPTSISKGRLVGLICKCVY